MAKRAGPKTRRMSPGRRAVTRLKQLQDLNSRVSGSRIANPTDSPDTETSEAQGASSPVLNQPNLVLLISAANKPRPH
jgi:hypothetical protein